MRGIRESEKQRGIALARAQGAEGTGSRDNLLFLAGTAGGIGAVTLAAIDGLPVKGKL